MPYPDAEDVLTDLLADLGTAVTALPEEEDFGFELLPMIVVNRIGGAEDGITDHPIMAVLVVAKSRREAWRVSGLVRERIASVNIEPTEAGGVLIDASREVEGNNQVPDINPDNRVVDSTYVLDFRAMR